ncbi:MAG: hemoglobin [Candidatus Electronema aureum]|uniref:Hemoglobin n=1 Tax=Candidatus Electronema aureum TaxID=2005002 RepID=A0A521G2V9_9BACT|nr:MAG: hemoglobin [Candidatus Electronema aureum]
MKKTILVATAAAAFLTIAVGHNAFAKKDAAVAPAAPETKIEVPATEAAKPTEPTLYEQLGGEKAVDAAVDLFYKKVLADDRVNGFFKGVDMDRQRAMQKAFLTFAFGGPNAYAGRDLRTAHAHLVQKGLNDSHFDVILEHLGAALKELGVKDDQIKKAADVANSVRKDVLNK